MFERFGLMDVWSSIKRYKTIILSIILGTTIIFGALGIKKVLSVVKNFNNINQDKCISSVSYYVEPVLTEKTVENTDMNFYKTLPDDYAAILNADFCKQYIYEQITSKYSNEYIVENSSLGRGTGSIKPEELCIMSMKELYTVGQYENTMLVNIFSDTYDEKLSDDVLKACEDYLVNKAQSQIKNANLIYAGGAKQILSPSQVSAIIKNTKNNNSAGYKKQTSKTQAVVSTVLKSTFLPIFIITLLCCAVACLIALFNPTLNRKSDFTEYEIPILGEIENHGKIKEVK